MAASDTPIDGSSYYVEVSEDSGTTWLKLGNLTASGFSANHATREVTDVYSAGANAEFAPGKKSATLSGEGNVAYAAEAGFVKPNELHGYWDDRTKLDIRFTTANTGDFQYSCKAYVNDFSLSNPNLGETQTYSISFQVTGAVTAAAVA